MKLLEIILKKQKLINIVHYIQTYLDFNLLTFKQIVYKVPRFASW
jgi:hypothetical protein